MKSNDACFDIIHGSDNAYFPVIDHLCENDALLQDGLHLAVGVDIGNGFHEFVVF